MRSENLRSAQHLYGEMRTLERKMDDKHFCERCCRGVVRAVHTRAWTRNRAHTFSASIRLVMLSFDLCIALRDELWPALSGFHADFTRSALVIMAQADRGRVHPGIGRQRKTEDAGSEGIRGATSKQDLSRNRRLSTAL